MHVVSSNLRTLASKQLSEPKEQAVLQALEEVVVNFGNLICLHEKLAHYGHNYFNLLKVSLSHLAFRIIELVA